MFMVWLMRPRGGEAALDIDVPDDFLDGLADMFGL